MTIISYTYVKYMLNNSIYISNVADKECESYEEFMVNMYYKCFKNMVNRV